jgi:hypothetical protein
MSQHSLTRVLLTPSILSGYLVFFITLAILGIGAWSYLSQNDFLHDYLFGPFGVVTAALYAPDSLALFRRTVVNNPLTYNAFIAVCALLVGVLAYELLESIRRLIGGTSMVWYEFHARTPEAHAALVETLVRMAVRCSSALGFVLYAMIFANMLVPFCILMVDNGIDQLSISPLAAAGAFVMSLVFLMFSLHIAVVLIRLAFLRPRLFGGWAMQID